MKKFRFQLLRDWIVANFPPCRVADIGGGKGMLTYLLREEGWDATVIDPELQPLPPKYKSLRLGRRVRLDPSQAVPHIREAFRPELARHFDLLVGMHAHGCNMAIIEAAETYQKSFVLLPCCVIGEPRTPPPNVHWIKWLGDVAQTVGFDPEYFELNFKGQNIGLCGRSA